MTVRTYLPLDCETQNGDVYKLGLEGNFEVLARLARAFAPHEQDTANMTVRVDAGSLWVDGAVVEAAAQDTSTITAPTGSDHRIDRVVVDTITGAISVITGTPGGLPRTAPAITTGKLPVCQVALAYDTTSITNALITDERIMGAGGAEAFAVGGVYHNTTNVNPATELNYGTWEALDPIADPSIKLLLHGDGSGAAFVDSSPFNRVITPHGGITQSPTQSKFGGKSIYIPGFDNYLTAPASIDFAFPGDFTIHLWVYFDVIQNTHFLGTGKNTSDGFCLYYDASHELGLYCNNGNRCYGSWTPTTDVWYHLAAIRRAGTINLYVLGTSIASAVWESPSWLTSTTNLYIGRDANNTGAVDGYMDEIHIVKDIAKWTGNFTPPTFASQAIYPWRRAA